MWMSVMRSLSAWHRSACPAGEDPPEIHEVNRRRLIDRAKGLDHQNASRSARLHAASQLVLGRQYPAAIAAYRSIAEDHPEMLGLCLSGEGVCRHLMGEPQGALESYEVAWRLGDDSLALDRNINAVRKLRGRGPANWRGARSRI